MYHLDGKLWIDGIEQHAADMFVVVRDGYYGVLKEDGDLIVPFEYDHIDLATKKLRWKAKEIYELLYRGIPEINSIAIQLDDQQFLLVIKMHSRLEFSILNFCQQQELAMQFIQIEDIDHGQLE